MFSIFFEENDIFFQNTHQIYNPFYIFLLTRSLFCYSRCFHLTGLYLGITTEGAGTDSLCHTLTCPTRHLGQQQPLLLFHRQIEETNPCFPSFPLRQHQLQDQAPAPGIAAIQMRKGLAYRHQGPPVATAHTTISQLFQPLPSQEAIQTLKHYQPVTVQIFF